MAHSDLVHVKQEGDTCKPLRGPDHNISVYEGQWTWSWIWVTILWNATSNSIFRLTLVAAQAAAAEWPRLSRPEGFILSAVRTHIHSTLKWSCLVKDWCSRLQRFSKEFFSTISCKWRELISFGMMRMSLNISDILMGCHWEQLLHWWAAPEKRTIPPQLCWAGWPAPWAWELPCLSKVWNKYCKDILWPNPEMSIGH